jgi:CRISPR-associated protein Csm1
MQYFFGGYLNLLAEQYKIYVVYSGGDDAFLIGSWFNVLNFANALHQAFQQLSGKNTQVSFSAGIHTCHPKYPVARLGDEAGLQESAAKNHIGKDASGKEYVAKNAIRAFEQTLPWDRFKAMLAFSEELLGQIPEANRDKTGSIRRSLLQHLLQVIRAALEAKEAEQRAEFWAIQNNQTPPEKEEDHFEFYTNIGRLHALFTRRGYLNSDSPVAKRMLKDMADFERFSDYVLPFNYVLYKTRD